MGLLDGSIKELRLFKNAIIPLFKAYKSDDKFTIASIVKRESPILSKELFQNTENQTELLSNANNAVSNLCRLLNNERDTTMYDIINNIKVTSLFDLSVDLRSMKNPKLSTDEVSDNVWDRVANVSLKEIISYFDYITDCTQFGTHQGIKGLEFDRVMVIIDDHEARGFLFSYDKLFELKEKTKVDIQNEIDGKETTIDRTARLFYVTCSRAKQSLAVVAYTDKPDELKEIVLRNEWFVENDDIQEIYIIYNLSKCVLSYLHVVYYIVMNDTAIQRYSGRNLQES